MSCFQACESKRNAGPWAQGLSQEKRNSEAHGVPVQWDVHNRRGRNGSIQGTVQDSAPLALLRIPAGSRASSTAWSGPSTANLSCPRAPGILPLEPLSTHIITC